MENKYDIEEYNSTYKKVKNNRQRIPHRKSLSNKEEMSVYDEIISRAKDTIDVFQKQLEETIPSIICYENNINKYKTIKSVRGSNTPFSYKKKHRSARDLSGNSIYYQPILTDIENINNSNIPNGNIKDYNDNIFSSNNSNVDEYYKNLYQKAKSENIKLIKKINEAKNINIKNERKIYELTNDKNILIQKIKELEAIISEYENQSQVVTDNSSEKHNFSTKHITNDIILLSNERNQIIEENLNLKNEIAKILKDNQNLKTKIQSFEKNNKMEINNNANINKNHNNTSNEIKKSNPINNRIKNNNHNSFYNKSFRVISNLSLYNKNSVDTNTQKQGKNNKKRINRTETNLNIIDSIDGETKSENNRSMYANNSKDILKNENNLLSKKNNELKKEIDILKSKINELVNQHQINDKNKDIYITDLEKEKKQSQLAFD